MTDKRYHSRHHRRLPSIPTRRSGRDHLLSYRESENWLLRHQDVLNKSISLLELHPKLIQHRACNKLWDFVSKVSICSFQSEREKLAGLPDKIEEEVKRLETDSLPIPLISVMNGDVSNRNPKPLLQRVYVCGKQDDVTWHPIIVGLCSRFLVTYCYHTSSVDDGGLENYHDIHEDDVVLFLLDKNTITMPSCLNLLKAATERGVRVVYIRHSDFIIPADVQIDVEDIEVDVSPNTNNNYKNRSGQDMATGNRLFTTQLSTESDNMSQIRPDSGISMVSGISSRSGDKMVNKSTESSTNRHVPILPSIPDNDRLFTKVPTYEKFLARTEMIDMLNNGYNKAFIYNKDNHESCLISIINDIDQKQDQNSEPPKNNLEDSDTIQNSNKDTEISQKPEQNEVNYLAKRRMSCRRESVDTVFFVYPSGMLNEAEPKLVRYPKDLESMRVPPSPSTESFGFQDIDLSVAINELDLFSTDDEEELN